MKTLVDSKNNHYMLLVPLRRMTLPHDCGQGLTFQLEKSAPCMQQNRDTCHWKVPESKVSDETEAALTSSTKAMMFGTTDRLLFLQMSS